MPGARNPRSHLPLLRAALCIAVLAMAGAAAARDIEVPLSFDHALIRQILLTQLYTAANNQAVLWDTGTGCGYLKLREPAVSSAGSRLRIVSRGEARVGTPIGDTCLAPLQWDGFIEVFEEPQLSDDRQQLQFRVVESNLYDTAWKKGWTTGKLWDLVKEYVQPRFAALRIDLHTPLQDLRDLLPLIVAPCDADRIGQILESVHLTGTTLTDEGITAHIAFAVAPTTPAAAPQSTALQSTAPEPDVMQSAAPPPEPTLSAAELQQWDAAWQRWDAFLTFVVKQLGSETAAMELRSDLADVLIDARFDILEALAPSAPGAPDPTRALFLKAWEQLAPLVRQAAAALPSATALQYVSFIAAGDALAALDQAGPDLGLDISADGLRRMARIVAPLSTDDPLLYNTAVDPQLRQVVGLGAPLPSPDLSDAPPDAEAAWKRTDDGQGDNRQEDNRQQMQSSVVDVGLSSVVCPSIVCSLSGAFASWWQRSWLLRPAVAAEEKPAERALQRWVADPDVIDTYLQAVREVLDEVTQKNLAAGDLGTRYHEVYHRLVLAAAWQESCWRQFIRASGAVTYLKSAVGSSGMMQVNEHVWRGLYDLRGLRWDIRYNGRAGSEILLHYLQGYAIAKKEDAQPGGIDNLARATYAVYNGGPGHLARYRKPSTKPALRRIDQLFEEKYRAVSTGKEAQVSRCIVGG